MKYLLVFLLALPIWAHAQDSNLSECSTDSVVSQSDDGVAKTVSISCYSKKEKFVAECEKMGVPMVTGGIQYTVYCNWTEDQAIQWGLTNAPAGTKIEWAEKKGRSSITIISDMGQTQCGVARKVSYQFNGYFGNNERMQHWCLTRQGWKPFRG